MALTSQITTSLLQVDGRMTEGGVIEIVPGARLLLDVGVEDIEPGALLDEIATAVSEAQAARDEAVDISGIATTDDAVDAVLQLPGGQAASTLAATIEAGSAPRTTPTRHAPALNLYFPEAEGAVADAGVTDSTAALQAAFDAAPAGATVCLQPTGSGAFYKITDTITITKHHQRLAGPGRDGYASSIRCAVAGKTMFAVKASGFVMEDVGLFGDTTLSNGEGATVTGLVLYGDTDGNIDARILATFQWLAVAVRNRGRNTTFMPSTLVSNCLDGIIIDGIDGTYHTGPAADQNRGNRIDMVRFHNIGTTSANAAVKITTTAKVQHAIISGCHFDSNGFGRHVVAAGTSSDPHKKITCVDNKHTETSAAAYDFTYVNDSCISAQIGGITPVPEYDAIVLNNCNTVEVFNTYGVQVGRSGLYARNCVRLRVRNVSWRSMGQHAAALGHGFDIDSTNSECDFDNLAVEFTDGYGFKGSPATSRFGSYDFVTCGSGRFDSTVFGPPVITVPAQDMTAITGTPNLATLPGVGYPMAYQFDAATTEQIVAQIPDIPDDWKTFDVVLWWAATNSGAGNVVWQNNLSWMTAGALPGADTVALGNDIGAAPGVGGQIVETVVYTNLTRKNAGALIRVVRAAADASDTYASDAALIAVRLVRAS